MDSGDIMLRVMDRERMVRISAARTTALVERLAYDRVLPPLRVQPWDGH